MILLLKVSDCQHNQQKLHNLVENYPLIVDPMEKALDFLRGGYFELKRYRCYAAHAILNCPHRYGLLFAALCLAS